MTADLEALGWTPDREPERADAAARGLEVARVVRVDRGACHLRGISPAARGTASDAPHGDVVAKLLRKLGRAPRAERPAVGDWVAVRPARPGVAPVVTHVLPRRSAFRRKVAGARSEPQVVAANVDVVLLAVGLDGDFSVRRLERMVVLAKDSGARPVAVLTKADLVTDDVRGERVAEAARVHGGLDVHPIAASAGAGLDALGPYLTPGNTVAVLGSSGVGKSTLVNALLGEERMATRAVRAGDDRGRHTTTHRELVMLPGGALLIDTPGMRELGLVADDDALDRTFDDVVALVAGCRFSDCNHRTEPGCAVRSALADDTLDPARWDAYQALQAELAQANQRRHERRAQERALQHRYRRAADAKRRR